MELNQAKELIVKAYNDYSKAYYFYKSTKRKKPKKEYEEEMLAVKDRVKSIFSLCPELYGFTSVS